MKTKLAYSNSFDPWYNLAIEEYLLNHVAEDEIILYLWQNDHTVVIGKYQNAWKECRCQLLEQEGGKIARRLSGGGAVYHDLGNLNFTFIMDRKLYNLEKQLQVILNAVKKAGIEAEFTGRNDITVDGKKFSGNAFCFLERAVYHHGTLLINSDMSKLSRYLQVSKEKMVAKAIEANSVQSRVVNLAALQESITIQSMMDNMKESFKELYGGDLSVIELVANEEIACLHDRYSSWEWRYGETPEFDVTFKKRFIWGEIDMGLSVEEGKITDAVVYSDAMDVSIIESLKDLLQGLPFRFDAIKQRIDTEIAPKSAEIASDINSWLELALSE
ncbi:MAG: lipoate--protein ligase [Syntrophomonadaceae bacterium]|jgi:lipoate-protein ligase A